MYLSNNSPVSAFAVYKNKTNKKQKSKHTISLVVPPLQKRKEKELEIKNQEKEPVKAKRNNKVQKNINGARKEKKLYGITLNTSTPKHDTNKKKGSKKLQENGTSNLKTIIKDKIKLKKRKKHEKKLQDKIVTNEDDSDDIPTLIPIDTTSYSSENNTSVAEGISELNKTDPSPEGLKLFKWLIAPLNPCDFFKKYWESGALLLQRGSNAYYSDILTTERLDGIFREFPLYYTRNVDVVSYENGVKEVHNEEGRVVASALYDYYSNGCSIRVLNPHTYDQKVHLLLATLQEYFGTMVGANIYLTPPGSQGFAPHYDDIEAFVLQLEGRKHWKLYRPKGSHILARDSSPNLKREDIGDPFMEVTLNAGDLLYFPRGTIHEGRTDPDAHSFHITVSVYQHTSYADLLERALPIALKKASLNNLEFRKGLPLNYLKHTGCINKKIKSKERKRMVENAKKLVESLKDYIDVDLAADQLGRKFMHDAMPPVLSKREVNFTSKYDGDLMKEGKIVNRVEISMDTEVRLLRYFCLRLVVEEDSPKIYYNTENAKYYHGEEEQFLIIDHSLIPCIEKLQRTYPEFIEVEDLPVEDDIAKAQLVSDLWERGLLVTNGPLPPVFDEEDSEGDDSEDFNSYEEVE